MCEFAKEMMALGDPRGDFNKLEWELFDLAIKSTD